MRRYGIASFGPARPAKTSIPGPSSVAASNLARRDVTASRPDEFRLADFTSIRTWKCWSYLAVILAVHARRIVGWQLAPHLHWSEEVAPPAAGACRGAAHHQGRQGRRCQGAQRRGSCDKTSPRRVDSCRSINALAESVIATLKRELISRYRWPTRLDLELALLIYIGWHNARRPIRPVSGGTPPPAPAPAEIPLHTPSPPSEHRPQRRRARRCPPD